MFSGVGWLYSRMSCEGSTPSPCVTSSLLVACQAQLQTPEDGDTLSTPDMGSNTFVFESI